MCICFTIVINAADVPHRPHVVDITYQGKYAEGGSTYKNDGESCYYYFFGIGGVLMMVVMMRLQVFIFMYLVFSVHVLPP